MIVEIVAAVASSLLAVGGAVLASYLWERGLRDHISVVRITSPNDKAIMGLLELYAQMFPDDDGTNYTCDDLSALIDSGCERTEGRHVDAENIVLAAKFRAEVVGFVLCHFYPQRGKAIISYLAVDKNVHEARHAASERLMLRLKGILLEKKRACEFLFFDLQGVDDTDSTLSKEERRERKARPRLFIHTAKSLGLRAYQLHFAYRCPRVSLDSGTREYPFTLMCIPVRKQLAPCIPKETVFEFLRFIYSDCYGDFYPLSDPRFTEYQEYLRVTLERYAQVLPELIPCT